MSDSNEEKKEAVEPALDLDAIEKKLDQVLEKRKQNSKEDEYSRRLAEIDKRLDKLLDMDPETQREVKETFENAINNQEDYLVDKHSKREKYISSLEKEFENNFYTLKSLLNGRDYLQQGYFEEGAHSYGEDQYGVNNAKRIRIENVRRLCFHINRFDTPQEFLEKFKGFSRNQRFSF